MAIGSYGVQRGATVSPADVEILLIYTPTRDVTSNFTLTQLNASDILTPYFHNTQTGGNANVEILGGMYNLTLPATTFNSIGFYTLYLKPVEIRTSISDCSILAALSSVKGLIIDLTNVPSQFTNNFVEQGLVGYRIEYLNSDGTKIPNFFRIITSSFYCEPAIQNITNTTQNTTRYRYTSGNSNLMFLTLSPSSAPTNNPNATPFIGQAGQNIIITNTFLNPLTIEIEITQYDLSSIAISLLSNSSKSIEDGIYTIYDFNNNIFSQYNLFEIRDQFNNLLYEVKQNRSQIDFSKNFNTIIQ